MRREYQETIREGRRCFGRYREIQGGYGTVKGRYRGEITARRRDREGFCVVGGIRKLRMSCINTLNCKESMEVGKMRRLWRKIKEAAGVSGMMERRRKVLEEGTKMWIRGKTSRKAWQSE